MPPGTKNVIYEVTATVDLAFRTKFEIFMFDRHIPDLMRSGCFVAASLSRSAPGRYRVCYEAHDRESLDRYFRDHAAGLRAHVAETFPVGVSFEREEWNVLARF